MNWKRAVMAAGAGVIGVAVICAGMLAALSITFYNWSPIGGGDPDVDVVQLLLFLTIPPTLFCVGGALPARVLGVEWRRSLAIALAAHVIAIFVLVMMLRWEPFAKPGPYMATPFIPAAVLTVLLAARYGDVPAGLRVLVSVIVVAAVMSLLTLLFPYIAVGTVVGILAWILLPAIAALFASTASPRLP